MFSEPLLQLVRAHKVFFSEYIINSYIWSCSVRVPCGELSANHWKGDIEGSRHEKCCGHISLQWGQGAQTGSWCGLLLGALGGPGGVAQPLGSRNECSISLTHLFSHKMVIAVLTLCRLIYKLSPNLGILPLPCMLPICRGGMKTCWLLPISQFSTSTPRRHLCWAWSTFSSHYHSPSLSLFILITLFLLDTQ